MVWGVIFAKISPKKALNYHTYLKHVKDYPKYLKEFKSKYAKKVQVWPLEKGHTNNINIISQSPRELITLFYPNYPVIACDLTADFKLDIPKFQNELKKVKNIDSINSHYFSDLFKITAKRNFIWKNPCIFVFQNKKLWTNVFKGALVILLSFILLSLSFTFTTVFLDKVIIGSYFRSILLMTLNILPIILLILILWFLSKRIWLSFSLTSFLILAIGIVNKTKLYYRDDVLKIEDFSLIKEAAIMTSRYDVIIRWYTVIGIILCIFLALLLRKNVKKMQLKLRKRMLVVIALILMGVGLYFKVYTNSQIYDKVGDKTLVYNLIATRQSQIRGLIYPLIYSSTELNEEKPDNYDAKAAQQILAQYKYDDIEKGKKVNIIGIMLEAYNDFSKFSSIEFTDDVYKPIHDIQKKSLHGNIIVDIFGGGTVKTERHFITGYKMFPSFRKPTYSYATYFQEQGYKTEAMHPYYGAFYNRNTVNANLGFDNYWNYENKYSQIQDGFVMDDIFFPSIIENLQEANKQGQKYFNFSVTFQNHGPYDTDHSENQYIKNLGYSDEVYNMVNNYFKNIKETALALQDLVAFLEEYEEPTVLIFFGDHNPSLGENSFGYTELGINLFDPDVASFENYYAIPYIIYGNPAAQKVIGKDFKGEMPTVSSFFLMNELFDYLGYKGNDYLKYTDSVKDKVSVIHDVYNLEDGEYVLSNQSKYRDLINEYIQVNYYYAHKKR